MTSPVLAESFQIPVADPLLTVRGCQRPILWHPPTWNVEVFDAR